MVFCSACLYAVSSKAPDGLPTTWPCTPIHYAINSTNSTEWQLSVVFNTMNDIKILTGRETVFDGFTSETLRTNGPSQGKILYEWYWPDDAPDGFGWTGTGKSSDGKWYTGANIYISPDIPDNPDIWAIHTFRHETGHALGLDHVNDSSEIMDPNHWVRDWGQGDQAGLQAITHARC